MGIGYPDSTTPSRPKAGSKDPLAEGFRLHTVMGVDAYDMSSNPVAVLTRPRNDAVAEIGAYTAPPIPVMPVHKNRNLSREAQAQVAKGRVEKSAVKPKKK